MRYRLHQAEWGYLAIVPADGRTAMWTPDVDKAHTFENPQEAARVAQHWDASVGVTVAPITRTIVTMSSLIPKKEN